MTEFLNADERRQAMPAIRGYVYQIWHSLYAWVTLKEGQLLYLEGAEDFDKATPNGTTVTQVRYVSRGISLGTEEARTTIDNFLALRERNPGRQVSYRYLTTASAIVERASPFGEGIPGIDFWKHCQRTGQGVETIRDFLLRSNKLTSRVQTFLMDTPLDQILDNLVRPLSWEVESQDQIEIERYILDQLVYRGEKQGVPPSESKKVVDRLLRETFKTATLDSERVLTLADYFSIFEDQTCVRIPRRQLRTIPTAVEVRTTHGLGTLRVNWVQAQPPRNLEHVADRESTLARLREVLHDHGVLVLTGSTGMGKTTLAKQLLKGTDTLFWIRLSSIPVESRAQVSHSLSLLLPSSLTPGSVVVLDDLEHHWFGSRLHDGLARLLVLIQESQSNLIITTPKSLPRRFSRIVGFKVGIEQPAPPLSQVEIASFAQSLGCRRDSAEEWSGIVLMHSRGHPQLVHAYLLSLEARNWPQLAEAPSEVFQPPTDLQREQEDNRIRLLSDVSTENISFLHYLSLMGSAFRRDHALIVGERLAEIKAPGISFDTLFGPWIEAVYGDYFAISPILSRAYESALSKESITDARYKIAEIFAFTGTMTPVEASAALMHSIAGRNDKTLALVCICLIQQWSPEVAAIMAPYLSWIAIIDLEGQVLPSWCRMNFLPFFRMLQFYVATSAVSKHCDSIVERWDVESDLIPNTVQRLSHRLGLCVSVVLGSAGTASLKSTLPYLAELEELRKASATLSMFPEGITLSLSEYAPLDDQYPGAMNFFTVMQRVQTTADLAIVLEYLAALEGDVRDLLLAAIRDDVIQPEFLHRPWIYESKKEQPEWGPIKEQLHQAMRLAESWGIWAIFRTAGLALVVVESEYLDNFEAAHKLLVSLEERCGTSATLLGHRATALFLQGRYAEALSVWREMFELQRPHPLLPDWMQSVDLVLARRKAAIAASEEKQWPEAVALFIAARRWADVMDDKSYHIALKADAAFSAFLSGDRVQSVGLFDESLSELAGLDEAMDAHTRITNRRIAHLIVWIDAQMDGYLGDDPLLNKSKPSVGFCSSPEKWPHETENLYPMPDDFLYINLCKIEESLLRQSNIFRREEHRLKASRFPMVRMWSARLSAQKDFRQCAFNELPETIVQIVNASAVLFRHLREAVQVKNSEPPYALSFDILHLEAEGGEDPEALRDLGFDTILAALFCIKCRILDQEAAIVDRWNDASTELTSWKDLPATLALVVASRSWSPAEARSIVKDPNCDRNHKLLATLIIATSGDLDVDSQYYAHAVLLCAFSLSFWRNEISDYLTEFIEMQWRRLASVPTFLQIPRLSVPAILAACDSSVGGHKKSAGILLAAGYAVSVNLPDNILLRIRELAEEPT